MNANHIESQPNTSGGAKSAADSLSSRSSKAERPADNRETAERYRADDQLGISELVSQ